MRLQRIAYLLAATLVLGLAVGCDKKKEEEQVQKGDLLIQVLVSNPDGWSGSCFIQMVDSRAGKTYDNSNAFQVGYGLIGREIGKYLYFFPDYGKNSTVDRFYVADGVLYKDKSYTFPSNEAPLFGAQVTEQKAYFANMIGKIQIVDLEKFEPIGEIDVSSYAAQGTGLSYPQTGFPLVVEGKVYLPLWQVDGQRLPKGAPGVDILVLDANTDKVLDHITSLANGLSAPAYPYGQTGFVDEKGDIYFICSGAFGNSKEYKDGIIRIKKDENKVDETYNWVLDDEKFDGHSIDRVLGGLYMGNGKYCLQVRRTDLKVSDPKESFMKDRCVVVAVLDIYNKTVVQMAPVPPTPRASAASMVRFSRVWRGRPNRATTSLTPPQARPARNL